MHALIFLLLFYLTVFSSDHVLIQQPGILQALPVMSTAKEHLASAVKRASRVTYSSGIRNETEKERNKAARQVRNGSNFQFQMQMRLQM
jgi:hypothetical protein